MASVAVCPHCFLQLAIPDEVDRLARGECPSCHKEFELAEVVFRPIPEVVVVERTSASAASVPEIEAAENELLREMQEAMFRARDTVAEAAIAGDVRLSSDEAKSQAANEAEMAAAASGAARVPTLAELMARNDLQHDELAVRGPSFDLPNVPLVRDSGATVEFDAVTEFGSVTNTEFELDGVDFESVPAHATLNEMREPVAYGREYSGEAEEAPSYASDELPDASIVVGPPRLHRRRSPARLLIGTVFGGVAGLAIGYYILLHLLGPSGDFLEVAKHLPAQLLPTSFGRAPAPLAESPVALPREPQQPTSLQPVEESENVPAGYVESTGAPQPQEESLPSDDAPSYEPSQFADPAAEPLAVDPGVIDPLAESEVADAELAESELIPPHPLTGPTYTSAQLAEALATAERSQPGLVEGDLTDPAVRRTKGLSFAKMCDLAHALVFVDRGATSPVDLELQNRALQLFATSLAAPHTRDEVARIVAIWIDSSHRRHGGVFLSGTLNGGQIAGDVYEYQLESPDGGKYAVLASQPIDAADAADVPVAIVGTIVDRPAVDVAGYTGTAERAIFAASALPLE